ncbi:MAG: IS1595 family transposase [Rhizomicrobium sp.]
MTKVRTSPIHQMTVGQWEKAFPTEEHCQAYLAKHRWPTKVMCPRCGNAAVYVLEGFRWQCQACSPRGYRFSVIAGTIFENTNKPLRDWFRVIHKMLTSKKGVSALQIHREMGFGSYKTAWYMCHRVRAGLAKEEFRQLMGIVEVDETYVGGDDSNRHFKDKKGSRAGKSTVIGAVERKGKVVARVLARADWTTMEQFIHTVVSDKVSLLATDDHHAYAHMSDHFPHGSVTHSRKQYVMGAIHTNTIEGFWSILKRGIVGSYHKVSAKYLPLYVAEFQFRYNNRKNADIFGTAVSGF